MASLEVDASTKDLTDALIVDTPVQPTLDHYIRFVFLVRISSFPRVSIR